jgi:hypothetical protein
MSTFSPADVLAKVMEDQEVDLRLRNASLLDYLNSRNRVMSTSSKKHWWNVFTGTGEAAVVPFATAGVDQATGETVNAEVSIGDYKIYHQFSLLRTDLVDARSRGTNAIRSLFQTHVSDGLLILRRKMNDLLWNAQGTAADGGVTGVSKVLDNTYTYAGIDPTTYPNWVTIQSENGGTTRALSKALLLQHHKLIMDEETTYDAIFTSPTDSLKYNTLFDTIAGNYQIYPQVDGKNRVDLAPGQRHYDGIPIQEDIFAPVGGFYFFDTNTIEVLNFNLANADRGVLDSYQQTDNFSSIAVANVGGLFVNVSLLANTNPGVLTFQMFVIPQVKFCNRRRIQAITDIS